MADPFSFDSQVAAGAVDATVGGAIPIELPPALQGHGMLWPTPADQISDHSAEGAPWLPAARGVPLDPPQGPLWAADHSGPWVPFDAQAAVDSVNGNQIAAAASPNHQGTGAALAAPNAHPGALNIGKPFTVNQGGTEVRHLVSQAWDALTGRRVNPADAPSAPHEIYNSEHYTRPRLTPYQVGPLWDWAWADGQQFPADKPAGGYGISGGVPVLAARPQGSVAAQMPSDPYVADAVAGQVPATVPDYSQPWED